MKRLPPSQFTHQRFAPYALAIGQASLAWNYLHEILGTTFEMLAQSGCTSIRLIWYSQEYDRMRRKMLSAAIKGRRIPSPDPHAKHCDALVWLLAEINKLEDARNTTIHSPLAYMSERIATALQRQPGISSFDLHGNPRATQLSAKDLLVEFRWLRDRAVALTEYAIQINFAWAGLRTSLPDKPKLPTREHQKRRQLAHRKGRTK